jgi:ABC-type polysaccharide/polyol phosphate transport system ATPase subunit
MPAITIENVSKKYRIFPRQRDRLKEGLSFGKLSYGKDFWALRDINLRVERGSIIGLLGRNGAGKSTLLRLISGGMQPTSGSIQADGQVAALQMSAGFNPEFSGRENAFLNGLILGIDRKKLKERFDEIEELASLGEFMDQPVKTYSSGMRARLGFAVAATVEPEILLVDEALAVGDAAFRHVGLQKMRELRESGATIVFVSHSTGMIKNFCTEAVLMHHGEILSQGDTSETIDQYHALISRATAEQNSGPSTYSDENQAIEDEDEIELQSPGYKENAGVKAKGQGLRHGTGDVRIENVEVLDEFYNPSRAITFDSPLTVRMYVKFFSGVRDGVLALTVRNETGLDIFSTNTGAEKSPLRKREEGERVIVDFTFRAPLRHGTYSINAAVFSSQQKSLFYDWVDVARVFEVPIPTKRAPVGGLVHLPTTVDLHTPAELDDSNQSA